MKKITRRYLGGKGLRGGFCRSVFTGRFTESGIGRLDDFSSVIEGAPITRLDYEKKSLPFTPGSDFFRSIII